ncbi:MAG: C4-dicarboxylate ABC transporter [Gammaproteobacteria bacterium]|nr:MAG: C4-dicarboxylate ABC transporter [Gammaproteobacteria bacterium]
MPSYIGITIRAAFITMVLIGTASAQTFKIATLSPDGSLWMKKMRAGAAEIKTRTEQRVKFKFYPGGIMGDDKAVLRKIRVGQLHGGALAGGSLAKFYKDSQIYNLPLKFNDYQEVDFIRSTFDPIIMAGFEKKGFVTFGLAEGGFAYAMSKSTPITQVEQLKQFKVWVPNDDKASLVITQAYDISPIPLSIADVLPALQTGIINAVATSPIAAIALQWHTQVEYVTDIPLMYFYAVLAIQKKHFSKLSEQDQATVKQVMGKVFEELNVQNRKDNIAAFAALQSQGIQLSTPSNEQLAVWHLKAKAASEDLVQKGELSAGTLRELDTLLTTYRSQHAGITP